MMRVGVYSGSFNPVHRGHIALAQYLVQAKWVDQVWMIRSPRNPLKDAHGLLDDDARQEMLQLAVRGRKGLRLSRVEDGLPQPNYTIDTLHALKRQHPQVEFHLIVGADNWEIFDRWRDFETILSDFRLIVYPRPGYAVPDTSQTHGGHVRFAVEAPQFAVSSTDIRRRIAEGADIADLVTPAVARYIREHHLYL